MKYSVVLGLACAVLCCVSSVMAEQKRFSVRLFVQKPSSFLPSPAPQTKVLLEESLTSGLDIEELWRAQPHPLFGLKIFQKKHLKIPLLYGPKGKIRLEIGLKGYLGIRWLF